MRTTEWRLQNFAIPQLHVATDPPFLVQLNDDEYIVEEVQEAVDLHKHDLPESIVAKLSKCDARFEIGDGNVATLTTEEGLMSFEGWTTLDPSEPNLKGIFASVTEEVGGVFEDNVNGLWWSAG